MWDRLASEIWEAGRALEPEVDTFASTWSGQAADAFTAAWCRLRGGFADLDASIHQAGDRLRRTADLIESAQSAYDHAVEGATVTTAVGIGLTLFTGGLSDLAAGEVDAGIAATATAIVADLELGIARLAVLLAETADALTGLAGRFAVDFAIRAPEFASGPVGGGIGGVGLALALGERDPAGLLSSAALGAAEGVGGARRTGEGDVRDDESSDPMSLDLPSASGSTLRFADRAEARGAFTGTLGAAANRFFRGATAPSRDFSVTTLDNGELRFQFFTPARNAGYGKYYIQEVDQAGVIVRRYKDTVGPNGLVERKWLPARPVTHER